MDNRNRQSGSKKIVLKFPKRRYDGGTEIALIQAIERKREAAQFADIQARYLKEAQARHPNLKRQPAPESAKTGRVNPKNAPKPDRKNRVLQAIIMGPLEICVGLAGILTVGLAVFAFHQFKNPAMLTQSKTVFRDCVKTLGKGCKDTMLMPGRALQAALA